MKRPIFWIFCFYLIGVLGGQYILLEKGIALFSVGVVMMAIILCFKWKRFESFILPIFTLLGLLLIQNSFSVKNAEVDKIAYDNLDVKITGIVSGYNKNSKDTIMVTLKNGMIEYNNKKFDKDFKILAICMNDEKVRVGESIIVEGEIYQFELPDNPGEFNSRMYYGARNYDYGIYVDSVINKDSNPIVKDILFYITGFKDKVNGVYDAVLPKNEAGILKAMITGDKSDLNEDTKELFRKAGISHILAISGLHISMAALILFTILKKFLNKQVCSAITIVFLIFYMVFTGNSVSTVRAVIMCSIVLFGNMIFRDGDIINSISLAGLIVLLKEPLYLWDIGFQLSFVTVIGICCGSEIFSNDCPVFIKSLGMSFIASVISYPIAAHYFYTVPPMGIFINLLILPFMGIVVGFGMAVGLIGLISLKAGTFLCGIVFVILKFYEVICKKFTTYTIGEISIGGISIILVLAFYLVIISIYFYKPKSRINQMSIGVFFILFIVLAIGNRFIFKNTEIAFLDVGQGDSIVINTYDDKTFVIDGGGYGFADWNDNTGNKIVKPYLDYKNCNQIDMLFITHMDSDHAIGAIELLDLIEVKNVVISDYDFEESEIYDILIKKVNEKGIILTRINGGDFLKINEKTSIECLYPFEKTIFDDGDDNHGSMVLKFNYGKTSFLFTGDIGIDDEKQMLKSGINIQSDVLKLAHHGSKYSSSKEFLKETGCSQAVVSSGKNNVYKHPNKETLNRLKYYQILYFNTSSDGAVIFNTNGNKIKVSTMMGR